MSRPPNPITPERWALRRGRPRSGRVGPYPITGELGRSGMGIVFEAERPVRVRTGAGR